MPATSRRFDARLCGHLGLGGLLRVLDIKTGATTTFSNMKLARPAVVRSGRLRTARQLCKPTCTDAAQGVTIGATLRSFFKPQAASGMRRQLLKNASRDSEPALRIGPLPRLGYAGTGTGYANAVDTLPSWAFVVGHAAEVKILLLQHGNLFRRRLARRLPSKGMASVRQSAKNGRNSLAKMRSPKF